MIEFNLLDQFFHRSKQQSEFYVEKKSVIKKPLGKENSIIFKTDIYVSRLKTCWLKIVRSHCM